MIIYGMRAAHLKSAQSKNVTCPSCGTRESTVISVFRRHAHIFWIPLFPLGKTGVSQCQHCKATLKSSEMPDNVKSEYHRLKSESKGPIWQFSGLVLIAALVVWGIFTSAADKENEALYIQSPAVNDVYYYDMGDGEYSTMKVSAIEGDSISLLLNDYLIESRTKIYSIDKENNYTTMEIKMALSDLQDKYRDNKIIDIKR
ncbi:zinc ribbon domain-containing protein [Marinigracilibium pacificum]|uniref:Zinc ribbon family protein n=1 Tax=Marinigracilibium pacificum TaxID=2729599 RepID=A0A848IZJ5_9BACT|nr:hypothetical protein [Marinigracilibium pacificum]NMM47409.1 hypothetical protein [Marinigracilibium pacificum]